MITIFTLCIIFFNTIQEKYFGPFKDFVHNLGIWGYVAYAFIYIICTVLMVPGSLLTLLAGAIFPEIWQGFCVISVGSTIGASCAFLLGRYALKGWVTKKMEDYKIFAAINIAISKKGLLMVFLLRLSPAIPFNVLNYAFSLTTIKFWQFALASWIGMAPGTFMFVYVAWVAIYFANNKETTKLWSDILKYGGGGIATIAVVVLVTYFARKEINKALEREEEKNSFNNVDSPNYGTQSPV